MKSVSPIQGSLVEACSAFFDSSTTAAAALLSDAKESGSLESADILRFAIAPVSIEFGSWSKRDTKERSLIEEALQSAVVDRLVAIYEHVTDGNYYEREFQQRRHPLQTFECDRIIRLFKTKYGIELPGGGFAVTAMNEWFFRRGVPTPTPKDLDDLANACGESHEVGFGATLFMENGGNYQSLEANLSMASRLNPERDASALVLCVRNGRVHAGEFTYRNSLVVDTSGATDSPFQRMSIQAVRPVPLVSAHVIRLLEDLLSSDSLDENDLQRFFNHHPELLASFGSYTQAFPHLSLVEEGRDEMIPDYLLELPGNRGFDILDLKLPTAKLTAGRRYPRISAELTKAMVQLRNYQNFFDRRDNRKAFLSKYGLEPYRPEVVVVMGRSAQFSSADHRKEIEEQLGRTRLLTYDDVIDYGRSRAITIPKAGWIG